MFLLPKTKPQLKRYATKVLVFWIVFLVLSSLVYLPMSPFSNVQRARAADTYVFIATGTTSWPVPPDWSDVNTIEVIGGGAAGVDGGNAGSGGGGAGAYAKVSNVSGLTAGSNITVQVGAGGSTSAAVGTDTYFNLNGSATTTCASTAPQSVCAKGGRGGSTVTGGLGGATAKSIGTTKYAGGDGGTGHNTADGGGGGGGAGGPNGVGKRGGNASTTAGGGGGGADNGADGNAGGSSVGGNGGVGPLGNGGGTGGSTTTNGADGTSGGGGGGTADTSSAIGGAGGPGAASWTQTSNSATAGAGGGGGGGANSTSAGAGGLYGGGGGGADGTHGAGANGIIVVKYTPAAAFSGIARNSTDSGVLSDCDGSQKNIAMVVATSTPGNFYTTCNSSTGAFSFSLLGASIAADTMITLYIDGESSVGTTVIKHAGSGAAVNDIRVVQNRLHIRNDSTGSLTNANLAGFDSDGGTEDTGDTDVNFTSNSNNLSVESGQTLYVNQGDTYDPGGTVTTTGSGADFVLGTSTIAYLDTTGNTIAGDVKLLAAGGTGGQLYLDANTTITSSNILASSTANVLYSTNLTPTITLSGSGSIYDGNSTSTFYNLTTSGSGTTVFRTDLVLGGDLSVGSGTTLTNGGPHSMTVAGGDATGDGTLTMIGGTFNLTGTGYLGGAGNWTFASTTIGTATTASTTAIGTGTITATSTLTIGSGSYFFAGAKTIIVSSTTDPLTINGDFEPGSSTLSYRGTSGTISVTATSTYNLDFSPVSGSPSFSLPSATTTVANDLSVNTYATVTGSADVTVLGGDVTGDGTILLTSSSTAAGSADYLINFRSISAGTDETGGAHACAVSNSGYAYCWGNGLTGQLGDNQEATDRHTPVRVEDGAAASADTDGTYLTNIKEISGGSNHTCAVSNGGNAYCWGLASSGQLGDNQTANRMTTPVRVEDGAAASADTDGTYLTNIRQINAGWGHTCAVSNGGNTYCWGGSINGKLGNNVNSSSAYTTPVRVLAGAGASADTDGTNLINIKEISGGSNHTCAVSNGGNAYCWGNASSGKLGNNQNSTHGLVPVRVEDGVAASADTDGTNLVNTRQISAGETHTCAVSNGGNAYCWGSAASGKLGDNQNTTEKPTPVRVEDGAAASADTNGTNLINIRQMATGDFHTCAVSNGGNAYCWGSAASGKLGDNQNTTDRFTPVRVLAGAAVSADSDGTNLINIGYIEGGHINTCAISNGGNAYCWGDSTNGRLGDNQNTTDRFTPVRVHVGAATEESDSDKDSTNTYLYNVRQLAAGSSHTCAISNSGNAYCWGGGAGGTLGNNNTANQTTPVKVEDGVAGGVDASGGYLINMKQITVGDYHTCAISNATSTYCWGVGLSGRLGNNDTANQLTPVRVEDGAAASADTDGTNLINIRQISAGSIYTCAISNAGNTYCWGAGSAGQLGNNDTANQLTPVRVEDGAAASADTDGTNLINIRQIAGGGFSDEGYHTCAISNAGNTYCWGRGSAGRLGNNNTANQLTPVRVEDGAAASADTDGTNLINMKQIRARAGHTCAISNAGNAYCWGFALSLGNNNSNANQLTPVRVEDGAAASADTDGTNLINIRQISTGLEGHTCAISNAGNAYCWGKNSGGALGNNDTANQLIPVRVLAGAAVSADTDGTNLINLKQIAGGDFHTCAISNSGNAYCWGRGAGGDLGNNNTANQLTPVRVEDGAASSGTTGDTGISSRFTLQGTGQFGGNTNWKFDLIDFKGTTTGVGTGSVTSTVILLYGGARLDAGGKTWIVTGTATSTPFNPSGTFVYGTSTISYRNEANLNAATTTYYNLEFAPTAGPYTYQMSLNATTTITNNLSLVGPTTLDLDTIDKHLVVNGAVTIGSGTTFKASGSSNLWIGGNFTNNGTFTHSNGTTTFFMNPALDASTISGSTTFHTLLVRDGRKVLKFQNGTTFSIAQTFSVNGENGRPVDLFSSSDGSQWTILFYNAQSGISWVRIKDAGCNAGSASATLPNSVVNNGNNGACWAFSRVTFGGHGGGGSPQGTDGGAGSGEQQSGGTGTPGGGTDGGAGSGGQQTGGGSSTPPAPSP